MPDVTRILDTIEDIDASAAEQLLPLVYDKLRKLAAARMAQESPDHVCRRRRWFTRRICGLSMSRWLSTGTVGGISTAQR